MIPKPSLASSVLLALAVAAPTQQPVYHAARQAAQDQAVATLAGGVMLSIPGLGSDFVIAGGGQFVQLPNGTARLTGRVFSESNIYHAFLADVVFQNRVAPPDPGYPPSGAPLLQLLPIAYSPVGPVDPATFVYYTAASGTLTGVRNLDGGVLSLQLANAPVQIGAGANNRNGTLGLEAVFQVGVVQHPPGNPFGALGTAELVADLSASRTDHATHPQVDPTRTNLPFGRAMVLPGVADDYVFVPAGAFTEYDDGHAVLTGTFARTTQLDDQWQVTLNLTGRIDPGEVGHPPIGSPVLQMLPTAYVGNGGTIDPQHWRYYQSATGTLVGAGLNAGGIVTLTNSGAVQVGGASNQTNTYFGYHGAFAAAVTSQPTGRTIGVSGNAELFGVCAVFPVLPFPVLTAPSTPYSLPTVTDQGVILHGDNLAWTELVGVDWDLVGGREPSQWFGGWFRILDNQRVELHPRPGAVPGAYSLSIFNPAVRSNVVPIQLTAPATPQLFSEAAVANGYTQHILVHSGTVAGPALSAIALSGSLLPTIYPGIVTLGIGDNNQQLLVFPGSYAHDPATGIARVDLIVPPGFAPLLHFQAAVLDLGSFVLPLPVTNVWSVTY